MHTGLLDEYLAGTVYRDGSVRGAPLSMLRVQKENINTGTNISEGTTQMRITLSALLLTCAIVLSTVDLRALPRFAAATGSKCQSCHVNPSGGGMRTAFGAQFGREELPVPQWSDETDIGDLAKLVPGFLGVGADFRTLYLVRQVPDSTGSTSRAENEFWQMQGDIYFNFRIARKVNLYFKKGLYSGFEVFGLLNVLPMGGHVKIGKFVPNYGLRLDDHTAYVRKYTGFSPETGRPEITGLEAAIAPGPVMIGGGVYNASDGFGATGGGEKAYLGRIEGRFGLSEKAFLGLGANLFRREQSTGSATLYGGFGSIGIGRLTLLGEGDMVRTVSAIRTTTGVLVYGEANYTIVPGVDATIAYDFYDPDKDVKSGATSRYSFGVEFFPISGVEVRPMYRIVTENPTDLKNNEFHFLFHIYL